MYSLERVKDLESKSNSALSEMKKLSDRLTAILAAYHSDGSRSEAYNAERIQKARDEALPAISAQSTIVTEIDKELYIQRKFYNSKDLALSMQTFNDDPGKDAAIRANVRQELTSMPAGVLMLAIESAQADKNLPLVYQCLLVSNARSAELAAVGGGVNLDAVDIPDQLEGLAGIDQAHANIRLGEFALVEAIGLRVSPEKRLGQVNALESASRSAAANRSAAARAGAIS